MNRNIEIRPYRIFSFGGGTQSTAVMVMQAQGMLAQPYDEFIFADVGEDSEHPDTVAYLEGVVMPYVAKHNINFTVVQRRGKGGKFESLLEYVLRTKRSVPIPMRRNNGKPGGRSCTSDWKILPIDKYLASKEFDHVVVGIGFSLDEYRRAAQKPVDWHDHHGKRHFGFWKKYEFPLMDAAMTRDKSIKLVEDAGLPRPPRSSCWFCPFTSRGEWIEWKKHDPETVQKAALLEAVINKKVDTQPGNELYLHPPTGGTTHKLLDSIGDQMSLFEEECDSGYCGL